MRVGNDNDILIFRDLIFQKTFTVLIWTHFQSWIFQSCSILFKLSILLSNFNRQFHKTFRLLINTGMTVLTGTLHILKHTYLINRILMQTRSTKFMLTFGQACQFLNLHILLTYPTFFHFNFFLHFIFNQQLFTFGHGWFICFFLFCLLHYEF